MILTPINCNNALLWGKDLKFILDGEVMDNLNINIPKEIDFLKIFFPDNWAQAKQYYGQKPTNTLEP
jgi:hypothetical protein